jgi:hypothetical protein
VRSVALVLLVLIAPTGPVHADCPAGAARASEFRADPEGAHVLPTGRCGGMVVASDATASRFSWGAAVWRGTLPAAYVLTLRVRRLTADSRRTFEIFVPGGAVLIRDGEVAFYESEAQFEQSKWLAVPGLQLAVDREIVLTHDGRAAMLAIDGRELLRYTFATRPRAELRLALKGYRGLRSEVLVSTFAVRAAQ